MAKKWSETRSHTCILALLVFLAALAPVMGRTDQAPDTRRVHVSAVDKAGVPVTDLTANDLDVKVGGKTQAVVGLAPAVPDGARAEATAHTPGRGPQR